MLRVLVPPEPIVQPSDVPGSHADDDEAVAAIIAAVTETIDGPNGWLWRALGEQTLELSGGSFDELACGGSIKLPCPPIIEVEQVTYLDAEGAETTIEETVWRWVAGSRTLWLQPNQSWPSLGDFPDAARVRYRAGYNGTAVDDGGTGDVPEAAKRAIIVSTQHLISVGTDNLFISSDDVEGVGRRQYTVTDQATKLIEATCNSLLSGFKVYS